MNQKNAPFNAPASVGRVASSILAQGVFFWFICLQNLIMIIKLVRKYRPF